MSRILLAAIAVVVTQAQARTPTLNGWELKVKEIQRPGKSFSDRFNRYSAKPGFEIAVPVVAFRDTRLAKEVKVKVRLLSASGDELGSLEWRLSPGPEPGKRTEWTDRMLVIEVPEGAALQKLAFGDISHDLRGVPGATAPAPARP